MDDLVDILELSMFINVSLFDEVDRGLRHRKKHIFLDTIYIAFS